MLNVRLCIFLLFFLPLWNFVQLLLDGKSFELQAGSCAGCSRLHLSEWNNNKWHNAESWIWLLDASATAERALLKDKTWHSTVFVVGRLRGMSCSAGKHQLGGSITADRASSENNYVACTNVLLLLLNFNEPRYAALARTTYSLFLLG